MKRLKWARAAMSWVSAVALASTMMVAVPAAPARAADTPVSIGSVADLTAFANAVNSGGDTYEGKTVTLSNSLNLSSLSGFKPIGTKEHPFLGTFDGNGQSLANLNISASGADASFVGLFGYVGPGGSIEDLVLEGCRVSVNSSTDVIRNVGSVAGYVYGDIGAGKYAIRNCASDAQVTVTSTMKVDADKVVKGVAPDDALEAGYTDSYCTIERVGGVVGYCAGSIDGVSFDGSLTATTHEACDGDHSTIANAFGGIAGQLGGYTIEHEDADAGKLSYEPVYPTADGAGSMKGTVSTASNCVNEGSVKTFVDAENGLDRFGEPTSAKSCSTGGIAGYAMANFTNCENKGDLDTSAGKDSGFGSDGCGGIVGILRMVAFTAPANTSTSYGSDAGCYKPAGADESARLEGPVLTVEKCVNSGTVIALHAGGGIVGGAGTYTAINQCVNGTGSTTGRVAGTRWNKPMCGGIAGMVYGTVSYCANRGVVASKLDGTGGGYYCAGVAGVAYKFTAPISETAVGDELDSPVPEIFACYSTGDILVGAKGMRNAGICGESEGFIHDCYFLKDSVSFADGDVAVDSNFGTVAKDTVVGLVDASASVSASDLLKSKEYVGKLNASASYRDYLLGNHFVPAENAEQNGGYPVPAYQRTSKGTAFDESKLAYSGTATAAYSPTDNPLPTLTVTYNGSKLVQGADYYPVPDASLLDASGTCKDVSAATGTYQAALAGIGDYSADGAVTTWTAPYTLGKGDFSTCTVWIKSKTFNWTAQYPAQPTDAADSEVVISDAAGNRVSASAFTMAPDKGECVNYQYLTASKSPDGLAHTGYPIVFTARSDSNYSGTVTGYFQISRAQLISSSTVNVESVSFNGKTWLYSMSGVYGGGLTESHLYRIIDGKEVAGMQIPYTGEAIKPTFGKVTFTGGDGVVHELKAGEATDGAAYRIVYGDPGDSTTLITNEPKGANIAVSSDEVGNRACMTFRYINSILAPACNFTNYQNIFFDIVPADVSDPEQATVEIELADISNPNPVVTVKGATGVTIDDSNYEVSSEKLGAAAVQVTVEGQKNLTGTYTQIFGTPPDPNQEAADEVTALIDGIGAVTLDSEAAIEAAEKAYAALTAEQKALVANYATLTAARSSYDALVAAGKDAEAASAVIAQIDALGEITLGSEDAIKAAEAAYAALTDEQKALVTNYAALTAARESYDTQVAEANAPKPVTVNKATVTAKALKAALKAANNESATKVTLGAKVKKVAAKAFKGTKVKTVVVKSKKLKKAKVRNSLKGSKVTTVKVPKAKLKAYKKIFTKKVCGKKVKVQRG